MTREVDVLIVTALKLEYEQVLKVHEGADDDGWIEGRGPQGLDVAFRSFSCASGSLRVAVTWAADMGMVAASTAALPLVGKYQPRCIAMCGVCAGRPGKVELGDVIVADRLWTYDGGKQVREKDEHGREVDRLLQDVLTYNLPPDWKHRAGRFVVDPSWPWLKSRPLPYIEQERWALERALENRLAPEHPDRKTRCPDWSAVIQRLWGERKMLATGKLTLTPKGKAHIDQARLLYPEGLGETKPFAVHVGPIGTGNKVMEDPTIWGRLSESVRKVLGLEMEACAIGAIADAQVESMRAIVMKGVMDVANPDRDDRYKTFAARASAEVLLHFLRLHLEPTQREPSPTPPSSRAPKIAIAPIVKGPVHLPVRKSEQELIGRNEILADVRRALDDDTNLGVALHGITGIGKTSLAEAIGTTDHARGVYPGGVFEVTGTTEEPFLSGLAALAETLGTATSASEEQKVGAARQRLAKATQRTLLIIDDIDPMAPWVERELRVLPPCVRLLVTLTVWPSGFLNGPGRAKWIEVPSLVPESAYTLLKTLAPFLSEGEIHKLNGFLDGYTLGLEVAAQTLANEPMLGVDGYLKSFEAARESMGQGATAREQARLGALQVQWDHLPETARKAWAMCGAFSSAPVPDGWLRCALAEAKISDADARSGLGELVKRHLATRVVEVNEVGLRFHPVVHAFARSMAGEDDRRAMALGITQWFEGTWDYEANLYLKARLTLPHVDAAFQNGGNEPRVARHLALALRLNDRPESLLRAVEMLRGLLSRLVAHPIDDIEAIAWVRQELARSLTFLGSPEHLAEAEALLRSTLGLRDAGVDDKVSLSLIVTLNDLGRVLQDLGGHQRLQEAQQLLRRALQLVETFARSHVIGMATVMGSLASTLGRLGDRERLEEAEQLTRGALRIQETALGADAPAVSITLINLATILGALGGNNRLLEAERLARRALEIDHQAFPDGSRHSDSIAANLAIVLRGLGGQVRIKEAVRLEAKSAGKRPRAAPPKRRR